MASRETVSHSIFLTSMGQELERVHDMEAVYRDIEQVAKKHEHRGGSPEEKAEMIDTARHLLANPQQAGGAIETLGLYNIPKSLLMGSSALLLATREPVLDGIDREWQKRGEVRDMIGREIRIWRPNEAWEDWLAAKAEGRDRLSRSGTHARFSTEPPFDPYYSYSDIQSGSWGLRGLLESVSIKHDGNLRIINGAVTNKGEVLHEFEHADVSGLFEAEGYTDKDRKPRVNMLPRVAITEN